LSKITRPEFKKKQRPMGKKPKDRKKTKQGEADWKQGTTFPRPPLHECSRALRRRTKEKKFRKNKKKEKKTALVALLQGKQRVPKQEEPWKKEL